MANKKEKNTLDREEYGHGLDLNPDDFDVIEQNNLAKKQNQNENKDKRDNKQNQSSLNN